MTELRLKELASELFESLLSIETESPEEWKEKIQSALRKACFETTHELGECLNTMGGLYQAGAEKAQKKGGMGALIAKTKFESCNGMRTIINGRLQAFLESEGTNVERERTGRAGSGSSEGREEASGAEESVE